MSNPWLDDGDVRLFHGDALDVLREMEAGSVDCVVSSPPYWGLRSYGVDGQYGLEETPDEFVTQMVAVFREVRRVLAPHGTCWVNLGDSYAANTASASPPEATNERGGLRGAPDAWTGRNATPVKHPYKPKDLCGIPWLVAFALRADGWYLRSDIVWAKPNPMPESVTDRPTKSHEYVFLLTKQPRYWFDAEAVREPHAQPWRANLPSDTSGSEKTADLRKGTDGYSRGAFAVNGREYNPAGRNIRSVWQIATQPYPEAHFATFPEELARRCVLAGCPVRVCRVCGKPSERLVERGELVPGPNARNHKAAYTWSRPDARRDLDDTDMSTARALGGHIPGHSYEARTAGWSDCGHNTWRPGQVLDPFIGSGTVAKVARDHGRHSIGIDLNATYLELAARRLQQLSLLT